MNLVLLIKSHPGIHVRDIAKSFDISERTIYRDFNTLSLAGFPVYSSPGKGGGYFIDKDCFLPPLRFTCEEAASLLIAAKIFLYQKGFPYQKNIQLALSKIEGILESENKKYMQKIDKKISVYLGKMKDYQSYDTIFQQINKAIIDKNQIIITYYTITRNKQTLRTVNPFHLMFKGGFWYLIAFCHWRNEIKIFRIDRIKDIQQTNKSFSIPSNFSLPSYLGKSWQVVRGDGETYKIEIKIFPPASRWVREEVRHHTQKITTLDNETILFTAEVPSFIEIKKWVLQLGSCAQVIEPEELKNEVLEEIDGMRERYRKKSNKL
jgi:predicted DNA-binding transcriptional regulator YafY